MYGFADTSYSIVASVGLTSLSCGVTSSGRAEINAFSYFSYFHTDAGGDVEIALTGLTGDPDIYVSTNGVLPNRDSYTWRSAAGGNDYLTITTDDPNYCTDCDYIVGIYAWSDPSTFTVMANSGECMRNLYPGRPQHSTSSSDEVFAITYFKMNLRTSADSLKLLLTMTSGDADIYVQELSNGAAWKDSNLPNPEDASSFKYTSYGESFDELTISGPHEESTTFLIGVVCNQLFCEFNIVGTFFGSPIVLLEGVPQRHFVEAGATEFFEFNLDREDADVQIVTTSITGDPDLLISSTNDHPSCARPDPSSTNRVCSNFTWMSADWESDEITIRHSAPCTSSGSSVIVSEDCDPATAFSKGKLFVGAYGFQGSSSFSITAKYLGGHVSLIPGQPQSGHTTTTAVCSKRDSLGVCVGADIETVQAGFFTFRVRSTDATQSSHINFAITPECSEETPGTPGCFQGSALTAYVSVCVDAPEGSDPNACTVSDKYPSLVHHDVLEAVAGGSRTQLFIANDPAHAGEAGYCNPINAGHSCVYYVGVIVEEVGEDAQFSIAATTPDDVEVVPCRPTPAPDGLLIWGVERLNVAERQSYEVCGTGIVKAGILDVEVETCSGNMDVKICDGDGGCDGLVPRGNDWNVHSTSTETCNKATREGSEGCGPTKDGLPRVAVSGAQRDTYFVTVEGGGSYNLRVASYKALGGFGAPVIDSGNGAVEASTAESGHAVELSWGAGTVEMAGLIGAAEASLMDFEVYYFLESDLNAQTLHKKGGVDEFFLGTRCGLQHAIGMVQLLNEDSAGMVYVENLSGGRVSIGSESMKNVKADYVFYVVGKCDSQCLEQVAVVHVSSDVKCSVGNPCKTVYGLWEMSRGKITKGGGGDGGGGGGGGGVNNILETSIVAVMAFGMLGLLGLAVRRHKDKLGRCCKSRFTQRGGGGGADLNDFNMATFSPFKIDGGEDEGGGEFDGAVEMSTWGGGGEQEERGGGGWRDDVYSPPTALALKKPSAEEEEVEFNI